MIVAEFSQDVPPENAQCNPLLGAPGDQVVYYVEDTNVNLVILNEN